MVPFSFQYYLQKGIIKKITPDLPRAKFLLSESENSFKGLKKRVEKMGIDDFSSNSIVKDIQDIILERVRAEMLKKGFSASGNYSHEAEVSFLNEMSFKEDEITFINALRKARNGITCYGTLFDKSYAQKCFDFLLKIKGRLDLSPC